MPGSIMDQINWKALLILASIGGLVWISSGMRKESKADEIAQIKAAPSLEAQAEWYKKLIERVGPEAAQDELYRSGLPFTGQTHLLNHTVGDMLYEQYGATGLVHCREYFLASCYHGFILHAITGSSAVLREVMQACREGGLPVEAQCAHALGHGFLAEVGYAELPLALSRCDEMSGKFKNFPVFNCQDGVFMENIWGVHEGERSAEAWLKDEDLIYPCNEPRIAYRYRNACWSNQPAYLYQKFNNLKKVGEICLGVTDRDHQQTCFNALARQIHPLAGGRVEETFRLCGFLPLSWQNYCVTTNAVSGFSVGDRSVPYELCAKMDEVGKPECYQTLSGAMRTYAKTSTENQQFCEKILEREWQEQCLSAIVK